MSDQPKPMDAGSIRVMTRTSLGLSTVEYKSASFKRDGDELLVTHREQPGGQKVLSRVQLSTVVQISEPIGEAS